MLDSITSGVLVLKSPLLSPLPGLLMSSIVILDHSGFNHTSCHCYPCREFMSHGEAMSHSSLTELAKKRILSSLLLQQCCFQRHQQLTAAEGGFLVCTTSGSLLTTQDMIKATGCSDRYRSSHKHMQVYEINVKPSIKGIKVRLKGQIRYVDSTSANCFPVLECSILILFLTSEQSPDTRPVCGQVRGLGQFRHGFDQKSIHCHCSAYVCLESRTVMG